MSQALYGCVSKTPRLVYIYRPRPPKHATTMEKTPSHKYKGGQHGRGKFHSAPSLTTAWVTDISVPSHTDAPTPPQCPPALPSREVGGQRGGSKALVLIAGRRRPGRNTFGGWVFGGCCWRGKACTTILLIGDNQHTHIYIKISTLPRRNGRTQARTHAPPPWTSPRWAPSPPPAPTAPGGTLPPIPPPHPLTPPPPPIPLLLLPAPPPPPSPRPVLLLLLLAMPRLRLLRLRRLRCCCYPCGSGSGGGPSGWPRWGARSGCRDRRTFGLYI